MKIDKFIDFVISKYGEQHQTIVAIEELSELQKELTKYLRGQENLDHLREELADAQLMIWQLQKIFSIEDFEILTSIHEKVERTLNLPST